MADPTESVSTPAAAASAGVAGLSLKVIYPYTLVIGIAFMGATAHTLAQLSAARKAGTVFDRVDMLIAFVIALFSGIMFGLLAAFLTDDKLVLHGLTGMGAFLGVNGINRLSDIVFTNLVDAIEKRAGLTSTSTRSKDP